ncbi:hypothetical protein GCM10022245_48310 [Streptomyces mayteni]
MSELSKGSCQKVAVAQALLAGPDLLVLDEAWTGLDRTARRALDAAVEDRTAAGGAVLFVDHDPGRLAGAGARVWRVEGGRLTDPGRSAAAVLIEAVGPPGHEPPPGLPGEPRTRRLPDGAVRFVVPPGHSDALLAALLRAEPAWHIRSLESRP